MSGVRSPTGETLTCIWERVLHRSPIGVQDNFFDIGGNPDSARQLFHEIDELFGKTLSPELIYQVPTIAGLGSLLEQSEAPRLQPVVLLKAGTEAPPLFFAHGMGGSVMEFFELVESLHLPQAIYGMQAKGNDGIEKPCERIEDLAQYYLDAIRGVQPHGPYFLVGYSLGGLAMLEVAQRLSANHEEIRFLAMIDSYPHRNHLASRQRLSLTARRVWRFPASIGSADRQSKSGSEDLPLLSPGIKLAYRGAFSAWRSYQPRFYDGKIVFIRAASPTLYPAEPARVWGNLTRKMEIETVPGDHHGMLMMHFEHLGAVLSRHVKIALQGRHE